VDKPRERLAEGRYKGRPYETKKEGVNPEALKPKLGVPKSGVWAKKREGGKTFFRISPTIEEEAKGK